MKITAKEGEFSIKVGALRELLLGVPDATSVSFDADKESACSVLMSVTTAQYLAMNVSAGVLVLAGTNQQFVKDPNEAK